MVRLIFENTGPFPRPSVLSPLALNHIVQILTDYVHESGSPLDLLLVGGLALQAYGMESRVTVDVDGEIVGDLDAVVAHLREKQVPADLGENMSGWSVVAMPPGYRERTTVYHQAGRLTLRLLHPVDFVIAKLRRGTDEDLKDAEFVVKKFQVLPSDIQKAADAAILASPKDTALFLFTKTVQVFLSHL